MMKRLLTVYSDPGIFLRSHIVVRLGHFRELKEREGWLTVSLQVWLLPPDSKTSPQRSPIPLPVVRSEVFF